MSTPHDQADQAPLAATHASHDDSVPTQAEPAQLPQPERAVTEAEATSELPIYAALLQRGLRRGGRPACSARAVSGQCRKQLRRERSSFGNRVFAPAPSLR